MIETGKYTENSFSNSYLSDLINKLGYGLKKVQKVKPLKKIEKTDDIFDNVHKKKDEAMNNLLSPKGIEIRINRSIQVEGAFGQLKQNMNYERIRRRGLDKVSCEIMLMCLGVNIRRYLNFLEHNTFKNNRWNTPDDLNPEIFPSVKQKKRTEEKLIV